MIYRLENASQSVIYFFFHIYAYDYSLATNHGVTPSSVVKRKTNGNEIKGTDIKRTLSNYPIVTKFEKSMSNVTYSIFFIHVNFTETV